MRGDGERGCGRSWQSTTKVGPVYSTGVAGIDPNAARVLLRPGSRKTKAKARIRRAKRFIGGSFSRVGGFARIVPPSGEADADGARESCRRLQSVILNGWAVAASRTKNGMTRGSIVLRDWVRISAGIFLFCGVRAGAVSSAESEHREAAAGVRTRGRLRASRTSAICLRACGTITWAIWPTPKIPPSMTPHGRWRSRTRPIPNSALWFRQWVEVPKNLDGYDLTGTRIWFRFEAWVNGPLPQIVYFNGRRVAMGDDLEPIVLFDRARPGDRVLIAVKLMATVDQKHFSGSPMSISFSAERPEPAGYWRGVSLGGGADSEPVEGLSGRSRDAGQGDRPGGS